MELSLRAEKNGNRKGQEKRNRPFVFILRCLYTTKVVIIMGCDGGSIPRRDELVKLKKKEEKVDQNELDRIKWGTCAISKEPLKDPIVADELGFLYNKEAVIRHLLDKSLDESFKHIRTLKVHRHYKLTVTNYY